jgi:hypothetical protein
MMTKTIQTIIIISGIIFGAILSYYINTPVDLKGIVTYLRNNPTSDDGYNHVNATG